MPIISCKNISLAYENKPVVKNLSFELNEGDYLCVIGENGSGKSTLIKALLGLKTISSGSVKYGGGLKRSEIGYLPQQTELQKDFPASVMEVVLSGCISSAKPFYNRSSKKAAVDNLELLGLKNVSGKCYKELSGGQQQRVLLARALCATKKLMILDEPVNGLDPHAAADLYKNIKDINKKNNITVIMVSHDVQNSLNDATHILHMHDEKPFFGDKEHYLECDECKRFLGEVHKCD